MHHIVFIDLWPADQFSCEQPWAVKPGEEERVRAFLQDVEGIRFRMVPVSVSTWRLLDQFNTEEWEAA